jgi:hypothetical protein
MRRPQDSASVARQKCQVNLRTGETAERNYLSKGEGTPSKLATATQPQLSRNVADFKQATIFQLSRRTLRKLMFD